MSGAPPTTPGRRKSLPREIECLRVLVVAGVPVGVLVAGVGMRLAMLVLRLTSPRHVTGITSDDGFIIGRVTLDGTYNLMLLGSIAGIIGVAAYRAVAPWLLGPTWFRRVTLALASGVVVGAMLVRSDGVDFAVLEPTWLAIALFVAMPATFAAAIGVAVDHVGDPDPDSWAVRGRRRWAVPLVLVVCFPVTVVPLAVAAAGLAVSLPVRRFAARAFEHVGVTVAVRAAWLAIAGVGLVALVRDIDALT